MSISFAIQGIVELATKVAGIDPDDIGKRIITKAAIFGENQGKLRSPVDENRLRPSITHRVDSPRQARYGTNVFYGEILDKPDKRTPHYRSGPHTGKETSGWLSDTDVMVENEIHTRFIPDEERRIESQW